MNRIERYGRMECLDAASTFAMLLQEIVKSGEAATLLQQSEVKPGTPLAVVTAYAGKDKVTLDMAAGSSVPDHTEHPQSYPVKELPKPKLRIVSSFPRVMENTLRDTYFVRLELPDAEHQGLKLLRDGIEGILSEAIAAIGEAKEKPQCEATIMAQQSYNTPLRGEGRETALYRLNITDARALEGILRKAYINLPPFARITLPKAKIVLLSKGE